MVAGHVIQAGDSMRPAGRGLKTPALLGPVTFGTCSENFILIVSIEYLLYMKIGTQLYLFSKEL